jgi:hypothetical protein
MKAVLTHPNDAEKSYFRGLTAYKDGHFRLAFILDYFGKVETPTKSQWKSLKKKLKRHDKRIFVLKEHGVITCNSPIERCGYVEFGYFAH